MITFPALVLSTQRVSAFALLDHFSRDRGSLSGLPALTPAPSPTRRTSEKVRTAPGSASSLSTSITSETETRYCLPPV
jgi:hypothetical protein